MSVDRRREGDQSERTESANGTAGVEGGGREVTRKAVKVTEAVGVGAGASLGEATLALTANAETVVAVGV